MSESYSDCIAATQLVAQPSEPALTNAPKAEPGAINTTPFGTETWLQRWWQYLNQPIDGASLAVFRICFGAAVLTNSLWWFPLIDQSYVRPKFNFAMIDGLHPLPELGMYVVFAVMCIASACVAAGWLYRFAAVALCVSYTYVFLLEKGFYNNHYYLIALLSFIFCFLPANRVWSLDHRLKFSTVPRWSLLWLKAQIFIVYFFGGIAKFDYDWLVRQEPMTTYLTKHAALSAMPLLAQPWFGDLTAYGGLLFDLSVGFLLWWRPTFWLGAVLAFSFHSINNILFHIGVFPALMMATIGLFAAPDWPRSVLARVPFRWLGFKRPDREKENTSTTAQGQAEPITERMQREPADSTRRENGRQYKSWSCAVISLMHIYLLTQILIPLRHFLYPGNPSWTERGHMFSWRMMLRRKIPVRFALEAFDPRTGKPIDLDLDDTITNDQATEMVADPGSIRQFAHYLADSHEHKTGIRPVIKVTAFESLNRRRPQLLIDPNVDLGSLPAGELPKYIVPLQTDDNARALAPEHESASASVQ